MDIVLTNCKLKKKNLIVLIEFFWLKIMVKNNHKNYANLMCFIKMCKKSKICSILKRREYYIPKHIKNTKHLYY